MPTPEQIRRLGDGEARRLTFIADMRAKRSRDRRRRKIRTAIILPVGWIGCAAAASALAELAARVL